MWFSYDPKKVKNSYEPPNTTIINAKIYIMYGYWIMVGRKRNLLMGAWRPSERVAFDPISRPPSIMKANLLIMGSKYPTRSPSVQSHLFLAPAHSSTSTTTRTIFLSVYLSIWNWHKLANNLRLLVLSCSTLCSLSQLRWRLGVHSRFGPFHWSQGSCVWTYEDMDEIYNVF